MALTKIKQSGIAANTIVGGSGIVVTSNTTTSQIVITSDQSNFNPLSFMLSGM